jgi:hypothetical protein
MTPLSILTDAKTELEANVGGAQARNIATNVETIAVSAGAHLLEVLLGEVPVAGGLLSQIADPVIDTLAAKLEAWIETRVDARLATLGKAGTISGVGVPPALVPGA